MLILARCDDRLIHGQCMTVITKEYDIKRILVVDDFTALNPILKTVFQTAVPSNMNANVYTVEESIQEIQEAMNNEERTMLLIKSPVVYVTLLEALPTLPKELNIGPMSKRKNTVAATQTAYLLAEEAKAIQTLSSQGIAVFFRQIPSEKRIDWNEVEHKFTA